MLTEDELYYQMHTLNDSQVDYPTDVGIHQVFEQQVKQTPNNVAVLNGAEQLDYQPLNKKANQLAHYLREQSVKPDMLVGLSIERSLNMMIAVLAILKAGGAYVPLDPAYPKQRLQYMMDDSGIALLLNEAFFEQDFSHYPGSDLPSNTTPDNLAYVIYTSGSTGQPKGVLVEHGGAINLAQY